MKQSVSVDSLLLAKARTLTGVDDPDELVVKGLNLLIEREACRRLTALGGADASALAPPRRRSRPH